MPVRSSERVQSVKDITDYANTVASMFGPALVAWESFSGELPGRGLDNNGGSKGGHSDRTAMLASRSDPFVRDRELFDAALELARDALKEAHRLVLTATVFEKADEKLPACRSCARANDWQGRPFYAPVARGALCRWCNDWLRTHGNWPQIGLVQIHHSGRSVTERDVAIHARTA